MEKRLKKSCFLVTYPERDIGILDLIERAHNDGLDAIEPYEVFDIWNDSNGLDIAKQAREKLEEYNMTCSCFSSGVNMLDTPDVVARLKKAVDVAKALGSPFLHHTMQLSRNLSTLPIYEDVEPVFVEISKEIAYYAGEQGIECIYENQGFLFNTPERIGSLLAKVDMPNTGICLDTGNALFHNTSPEKYAGIFGNVIKHVHVKDYIRKTNYPAKDPGWLDTINGDYLLICSIGHGVVDFESVITILLENGYNGYYSIEGCGIQDRAKGIKLCFDNLQYYYDRATENIK